MTRMSTVPVKNLRSQWQSMYMKTTVKDDVGFDCSLLRLLALDHLFSCFLRRYPCSTFLPTDLAQLERLLPLEDNDSRCCR